MTTNTPWQHCCFAEIIPANTPWQPFCFAANTITTNTPWQYFCLAATPPPLTHPGNTSALLQIPTPGNTVLLHPPPPPPSNTVALLHPPTPAILLPCCNPIPPPATFCLVANSPHCNTSALLHPPPPGNTFALLQAPPGPTTPSTDLLCCRLVTSCRSLSCSCWRSWICCCILMRESWLWSSCSCTLLLSSNACCSCIRVSSCCTCLCSRLFSAWVNFSTTPCSSFCRACIAASCSVWEEQCTGLRDRWFCFSAKSAMCVCNISVMLLVRALSIHSNWSRKQSSKWTLYSCLLSLVSLSHTPVIVYIYAS